MLKIHWKIVVSLVHQANRTEAIIFSHLENGAEV